MSQKKNEGVLFPTEIPVVGSYTDRLLSGFELHSRWVPLGLEFGTSNCYKSSALTAPPRLLREMSNLGEFAGPRYSDL